MAFVYFDQSHCGYLLEKDLEEILYTLGLHLSRAQVILWIFKMKAIFKYFINLLYIQYNLFSTYSIYVLNIIGIQSSTSEMCKVKKLKVPSLSLVPMQYEWNHLIYIDRQLFSFNNLSWVCYPENRGPLHYFSDYLVLQGVYVS